jgi:membrane protein DedA with SNARE-associated domain
MKLRDWLKTRAIPIVSILFVIGITVGIYLYFGRAPERLEALKDHAIWGAFLVSLLGNGTVIFPGAVLPILSAIAIVLYPETGWIGPISVGLAGGFGAAIGEITGYLVGYSGRSIIARRQVYIRIEGWLKKWGSIAIFLMSLIPFFFDVVGIAAGILRYPLWRFILLTWVGRTILYTSVALAAAIIGKQLGFPFLG